MPNKSNWVNLRVKPDVRHAVKVLARQRGESIGQLIAAMVAAVRRQEKKETK